MPAEAELLRFSVLRAADAIGFTTPIIASPPLTLRADEELAVASVDPDLLDLVVRTRAWLSSSVYTVASTVADLVAHLDEDPAAWSVGGLAEVFELFRQQTVRAVREAHALFQVAPGAVAAVRGVKANTAVDSIRANRDGMTAARLLTELATTLQPTDVLSSWISSHPIALDVSPIIAGAFVPHDALVREPAISDHFVVRDHLAGYDMGEIEDIKNYLRGEVMAHNLRHLTVDETEVYTERETTTDRTSEVATQQRSDMKAQAQSVAKDSIGFDAKVKTDGQYGPTRVSTDTSFQYASSSEETRQTAVDFATDVLNRSVEEIRDRELTRTVTRARTEIEEDQNHSVDNAKANSHLIGIYRWVESVWQATTYKLPQKHLLLELLIPEPGRAIRKNGISKAEPPGKPDTLPNDFIPALTYELAAQYAVTYGATGVGPPPQETLVISEPFKTDEIKDKPTERVQAIAITDLQIPDGYETTDAFVSVSAMGRPDLDVNFNVVIEVPGTRPALYSEDPQNPANNLPNPQVKPNNPQSVERKDIITVDWRIQPSVGPGQKLAVTVYTEDLRGFTGVIEVHCKRTAASWEKWQLDTGQAITAAYLSRLKDWEAKVAAQSLQPDAPLPTPDLDALCRHLCISSLLGGLPASSPSWFTNDWPAPAALAGASGRLIEFMEQAFEWSNLQYVAYPYYWADNTEWHELFLFDNADPKVREFLRAGAIRVVVPARFELTQAVLFFLKTGIPWLAGSAPIPGDPGYLAIADEIRESRTAESNSPGEAVDTYTYRLPTSLTILDQSDTLPAPPPA
jgi:hypothetical protein